LRKVAAICAYSQDDPPLRNPIIGIAVCLRAGRKRLRHRRMSARCPVCPKADTAGRFMMGWTPPDGIGVPKVEVLSTT
jgi:hypothetical protein